MSILSTVVQARNVQDNIGRLQNQIDLLRGQIGTGKKTDRFSGLGVDSRRSLELRATIQTYERYQIGISRADTQLQVQVNALNQMDEIINQAVTDLTTALDGSIPDVTETNQTAQSQLVELVSLMNTQFDDRFIFSGRGVTDANVVAGETRPPVIGFENDAAVPDGVIPGVDNYFNLLTASALSVDNIGPEAVGENGPDRIFARLDYIFSNNAANTAALGALVPADAAVANSATPNDYATWYNGDLGLNPPGDIFVDSEISQGVNITTNSVIVNPGIAGNPVPGNTTGYEDVIKAMSLFSTLQPSNGVVDSSNEAEFFEVFNRGLALLKQGQEKLQAEVQVLGERQAFVGRTNERNIEVLTFTEIALSNVEDVDVAKASTDLFQLEAQLEASYSIIGTLRNLRLSNFL
ncbi:MAG: hypothetical protein KI792_03860 [Alphaproteobacteria bacterium]|nr:hypothetical protein [Alphaproteobacteria bacterium SS10]